MTKFQRTALAIVKNSKANLLHKEFIDQHYGEIHRFSLKSDIGTLYFSITRQSWVPMRWLPGFHRAELAKMFDQRPTNKALRWDLFGDDPESVLFELEIRLEALEKYKRKKRSQKRAA